MSAFYLSNVKQVKLGDNFSVKVPNSREVVVQVNGDYDITKLKILITATTSTPDPRIKILSENQVKLFFEEQFFNLGTSYSFSTHVFGGSAVGQIEREVVTNWEKLSTGSKSIFKKVLITAALTIVGAVFLVADKKYNDAKIYSWIKNLSVTEVADKIEKGINNSNNIDVRIITNKHELYQSEDFLEKQEDISEEAKTKVDLKSLYAFVGDELFFFRRLVRDEDGIVITDFNSASSFCEKIGARIANEDEIKSVTNKNFEETSGFEWRIKDENSHPEWTSTEMDDNDYYFVYMKNEKNTSIEL